jgi:raffinose/stachyose/melibiose transport system substrate-binding protein
MIRIFRVIIVLLAVFTLIPATRTTAQDKKVTINWWHISTAESDKAYWQNLADKFVELHPNVTINITVLENNSFKERLLTVMQSNEPPDLFHSWGGGVLWSFAEAGLLRNIEPQLKGEWKDSFATQAALELFGKNGEYYGVPDDWGAVGLFYNKALFKKAGLDPENPPKTWSEFLTAVQKIKDAGITPIAFGEAEKWPGHFWWTYMVLRVAGYDNFVKAYERTGAFNSEPFVKATEELAKLVAMKPFPEGFLAMSYPDQGAYMGNGKAAMELMGQWSPNVQKDNSESGKGIGDDLGWFPFPAVEGGLGDPTDVMGGGGGFVVGKNAPDETIEFLRFLTSVDAQKDATFLLPVVKGLGDLYEDRPIMKPIVAARDNAAHFQLYLDQFLPPAMGELANDAIETLFAGTAKPQEVVDAIEEAAKAELK